VESDSNVNFLPMLWVDVFCPMSSLLEKQNCKERLNRDCTTCRKERFIGAQTAGLTLGFRVQQPGYIGLWAL
jgi:hypothetical protein